MHSKPTIIKKYLQYRMRAGNGKGHGVHSPFVFDFITKILNDRSAYAAYSQLETRRKELLTNDRLIDVADHGAGSAVIPAKQRQVKAIARSSPKNKKYAQLLFRIARYFKPSTIIELGTSFGITAGYLSLANPGAKIYTIEGSESISEIAKETKLKMQATNIEIINGEFDIVLPGLLSELPTVDMAFIDGNHQKAATLNYFRLLLQKSNDASIFIFDDIHWSSGMEDAWQIIREDAAVTLSIDLFFLGIVFMNPAIRSKQHFTVRF